VGLHDRREPLLRLGAVREQRHPRPRVLRDRPGVRRAHHREGDEVVGGHLEGRSDVEDQREGILLRTPSSRGSGRRRRGPRGGLPGGASGSGRRRGRRRPGVPGGDQGVGWPSRRAAPPPGSRRRVRSQGSPGLSAIPTHSGAWWTANPLRVVRELRQIAETLGSSPTRGRSASSSTGEPGGAADHLGPGTSRRPWRRWRSSPGMEDLYHGAGAAGPPGSPPVGRGTAAGTAAGAAASRRSPDPDLIVVPVGGPEGLAVLRDVQPQGSSPVG